MRTITMRRIAGGTAALLVPTVLAACSTTAPAASPAGAPGSGSSTKIAVVAAENFWGSIAAQLGGTHVTETSIITNPDTDPHDYEATASDARTRFPGSTWRTPTRPSLGALMMV